METETRQIQLKCLEILDLVDAICRKHEIAYSLCGGSVVGAHLYGACLPWDDDVDLMMTRENYQRFLAVVREELPDGFSVQNYQLSRNFQTTFTKILNENTTVVQQDGAVSGIFLDITVYDRVPNDRRFRWDTFLWKLSQIVMIGKVETRGIKSAVKNLALSTLLRDRAKYLSFFQHQVEKRNLTENYSYAELFGAFCNTKKYDPAIFENYTEIEFEGKQYSIVRDYVRYLETRYDRTDFHEPADRQIAPHYQFVDFSRPYKEYLASCR